MGSLSAPWGSGRPFEEVKGTKFPIASISCDSKAYRRCGIALTSAECSSMVAHWVPRAEGREQRSLAMRCSPWR
jgi:hypothetical protein